MGCIYICTNNVNNKQYIGQTRGPLPRRKYAHLQIARDAKHHSHGYFHNALAKYGPDNFVWEELCSVRVCEFDTLNELEELAIEMNQTLVPHGYNMCPGGGNHVKVLPGPRKRDTDWTLPKYVYKIPRGFLVRHHPSGQSTSFTDITESEETKLNAALTWLASAEGGETMPRRARQQALKCWRKHPEDKMLPKYIRRVRKKGIYGYYCDPPGGKMKQFASTRMTMEEKLQAAVSWIRHRC